ncbi:MAG: hypothetical protein DI592_23490, partial [Stenotrophomonas maltophilia]
MAIARLQIGAVFQRSAHRLGIAAGGGIAQAALELAVSYATERQAFGGPIARFQGLQFPIADLAAALDAA